MGQGLGTRAGCQVNKPILPQASLDSLHLQADLGWLELDNHIEANEELDRIAHQVRN
jgi:hypothetical protein